MARRSYSWDFRAEVLAVYEVDGPAVASRLYSVPRRTLQGWAKRAGLSTEANTKLATQAASKAQAARRIAVRAKLLQRVEEMLDRMDSMQIMYVGKDAVEVQLDKPPASVCKDFATTVGILLDKFRLEVGEPTGREEVRHDYSDRSDEDLIREAEGILRDAAESG